MKKSFYIILSIATATVGISSAKSQKNRKLFSYNYRLILTPTSLHDVTNTYNWTLTTGSLPLCPGDYDPCLISSNTPYTAVIHSGVIRKLPTIAISYKISASTLPPNNFAVHPNAIANINNATNQTLE